MTEAIWDLICGAPRHKNALAKSEAWKGSHLCFSQGLTARPRSGCPPGIPTCLGMTGCGQLDMVLEHYPKPKGMAREPRGCPK